MHTRIATLSIAAAAGLAAAGGPQVSIVRIAGPDAEIHVLGNRPALHAGTVAFYGYRGQNYGADVVVATAAADGGGGYTVLAAEGDPRPDVPGSVFEAFANPAIYNGTVVFYGTEFGTLSSTYIAAGGVPYTLYDDAGIPNPFFGPLGVTTPANPSGIALIDNDHTTLFLGQRGNPLPCGPGVFGLDNIPGFQYVPQGGAYIIWTARVTTTEYEASDAVVAYDSVTQQMHCVATGLDTIPGLGGPFDFFSKADTDGVNAAFIGMDPTIGFNRHEGVYVRDISGTGPITLVVDTRSPAPGGGLFGGFEEVTIDGDLVIFEACAGGAGGCAVHGLFGSLLEDGVPGPVFEILDTGDTIDSRAVIDVTMSPAGRDGHRIALDVRHAANSASLYVATVLAPCRADLNDDGVLNFFDVQAFLSLFAASDPAADFTDDGVFNFFDVQIFLSAFAAGCP